MKSDEQRKLLKSQYNLGFFTAMVIHSAIKRFIGKENWLAHEARWWEWDLYWVYAVIALGLIFVGVRRESRFTK